MTQINSKEAAMFGYGVLMEYWRSIVPLILIMLPALLIVFLLKQYLTNPMVSDWATNGLVYFPSIILVSLLDLWLIAPFHVSIYRLILHKEPIELNYYQRLMFPREIAYFWKEVGFTLILIGVMVLLGIALGLPLLLAQVMDSLPLMIFIGVGAVICFIVLSAVISIRLSLVFPAISVDQSLTFLHSYERLKGHTWKFLLSAVLAGLPLIGLSVLMIPAAYLMLNSIIGLSVITFIGNTVGLLLIVPMLAVIAYVFQKIPAGAAEG